MPQIGRRTLRTRERLRRLEMEGGSVTDLGPALGPEIEKQIEEEWERIRLRRSVGRGEFRMEIIRKMADGKSWKEIRSGT